MKRKSQSTGFTLIELMIVIAILGILASIAVPQYSQYTKRAKFAEVRLALSPIKTAIENCYQSNAGIDACNRSLPISTFNQAVTDAILVRAAAGSLIDTVTLDSNVLPVITATVKSEQGFNGEEITLSGSVQGTAGLDRRIDDWTYSGSACDQGWC